MEYYQIDNLNPTTLDPCTTAAKLCSLGGARRWEKKHDPVCVRKKQARLRGSEVLKPGLQTGDIKLQMSVEGRLGDCKAFVFET